MQSYLDLLDDVLTHGHQRHDRTGVGTLSVFGRQIRYDLNKGFPLLTTKKLHTRSIIVELLWFIRGDTNIKYLNDHNVTIWDEWADQSGDLGPVYGKQWRRWGDITKGGDIKQAKIVDQLDQLIQGIIHNPYSRRHIISAWNPLEIDQMALPPCHCLMQFYVHDQKLSCQLYQRSADLFLGVPFNIASYAIFTHMIAQVTGLGVGEFIHSFGDLHLYQNHLEQAREQLTRKPLPLSRLELNKGRKNIDDFIPSDIQINQYQSHPHIKADIAV